MMGNSATKLSLYPTGGKTGTGPRTMDGKPYAPRSLDETAKDYWREYVAALHDAGMLFSIDLNVLKDLCRWESLKERAYDELPPPEKKLYLEYYNSETGELTHVQSHAAFSNLRTIQSTINTLRSKLGLSISDRSGLQIMQRSPSSPAANTNRKNF
ncbi:MAG: P27 family phage terminase small subunit [Balneolaceae bacterium]|nr:P27 family phage terminase small subunit [Balneolaceae bacterium]